MFRDAVQGLRHGDFSRLEPAFDGDPGSGPRPAIVAWHERGLFRDAPDALAEALTCACFLGKISVVEYFLKQGVEPAGGAKTGLNALHWAANRGQLDVVTRLLQRRVPLETRNMYGGTVLGTAVWSAIHEPRPDHVAIIAALLEAGAEVAAAAFPTGDPRVDEVLGRFGAA